MENGWTLTNTYESLSLVGHMLKKKKTKQNKTYIGPFNHHFRPVKWQPSALLNPICKGFWVIGPMGEQWMEAYSELTSALYTHTQIIYLAFSGVQTSKIVHCCSSTHVMWIWMPGSRLMSNANPLWLKTLARSFLLGLAVGELWESGS